MSESSECIAAIDVGLKRIGIAIAPDGKTALPQAAILRKNRRQASADLDALLNDWRVQRLVVGLPGEGSGAAEMQKRIRHFVSLLAFEGEVCYMDEYGTSLEAAELMRGVTRQKKDGKLDSIAAQLILERWLQHSVNL